MKPQCERSAERRVSGIRAIGDLSANDAGTGFLVDVAAQHFG